MQIPGQRPSESQTLQVWGGGLGTCVSEPPRVTWLQGFQGTHLENRPAPPPAPTAARWAPGLLAPGDPWSHLLILLTSHSDPPDGIAITATRGSGETETKRAPKALGAGRACQPGSLAARAPALWWVWAEHLLDRLHLTKALQVPPSLHGPSGLTRIQVPGGPARGPLTPCGTAPRPPASQRWPPSQAGRVGVSQGEGSVAPGGLAPKLPSLFP